jgi:hypothetical protein
MTKLEGMTNDQMTNDRNAASSTFVLPLCFVIRLPRRSAAKAGASSLLTCVCLERK